MHNIPLLDEKKDIPKLLERLANEPATYWSKRGEHEAQRLFHAMAKRVPAYKDFLKKNGIKDHERISSFKDFSSIPLISKENYLQSYPLEDLCWDGKLKEKQWVISSTSGSSGKPFYFPRTPQQDRQFALTAELSLRENFAIDKQSTLFINCFALGVWIGGMFVYQAIKHIIETGEYAFATITPGADKGEALKAVRNLGSQFDQVIIGGYGPLVKDLVDEGVAAGIDWGSYNMKYFFAAEGFTEGFRSYLMTNGGAREIYCGTSNIYGTADLGAMAHETPLSVLVRRLVIEDPSLHDTVFAYPHRLPTFTQFIPELYYFEEVGGSLVCTAPGGLPLTRYDLKDRGEVWEHDPLVSALDEKGVVLSREIKERGIKARSWHLPFVSVYERNDFTVSIYSVNIYPESIKRALEAEKLITSVTGKFTMVVDFDNNQNQYLEINIELHPSIEEEETLKTAVFDSVVASLNKENSEYRDFYAQESIRKKISPRIVFWPHQDPHYFKPGGKQKWVKK